MRPLIAHQDDEPAGPVKDRWVFAGLLLLILLALLSLGSNRVWAIGILLVPAVSLLRMTVWGVMARRRSVLPSGVAFGVAMAIVGLLLHSTVDFNLQIPANALTMVVILALGWATSELSSKVRRKASAAPGGGA